MSKLIKDLVSTLEKTNRYPSKNAKKVKVDLQYSHISNQYFEKKDDNGVVSIHRIGITYVKEKVK